MGCAGCDLLVPVPGYGRFFFSPFVLADFIVTVIMLAALLISSVVRVLLQRRFTVPLSRLLTLFAAVFFMVVFFAIAIAETAVAQTLDTVRGSYYIIYVFALGFNLISLTLIIAHVGQLVEESLGNARYRRAFAIFNTVVIVLLAALACADIGLTAYVESLTIASFEDFYSYDGNTDDNHASLIYAYFSFCVEISYYALYLFAVIVAAATLIASLSSKSTKKTFASFTMLALLTLVVIIALQLAWDVLSMEEIVDYLTVYGLDDAYSIYDGPSIDEQYYTAIAPIIINFFQALVLIILMFVPSAGLTPEHDQTYPEAQIVSNSNTYS